MGRNRRGTAPAGSLRACRGVARQGRGVFFAFGLGFAGCFGLAFAEASGEPPGDGLASSGWLSVGRTPKAASGQ
jgi:hypothetical protein